MSRDFISQALFSRATLKNWVVPRDEARMRVRVQCLNSMFTCLHSTVK